MILHISRQPICIEAILIVFTSAGNRKGICFLSCLLLSAGELGWWLPLVGMPYSISSGELVWWIPCLLPISSFAEAYCPVAAVLLSWPLASAPQGPKAAPLPQAALILWLLNSGVWRHGHLGPTLATPRVSVAPRLLVRLASAVLGFVSQLYCSLCPVPLSSPFSRCWSPGHTLMSTLHARLPQVACLSGISICYSWVFVYSFRFITPSLGQGR